MTIHPSWQLLLALVALVGLAVVSSRIGHLGISRATVVASARAMAQLAAVSLILVYALQHLWATVAFIIVMFVVAVATTVGRTGVGDAWPWTAVAMVSGVLPVLVIIFCSGAAPWNAAALVPLAGIIIGNMMTGHTLAGRRLFPELREGIGTYEAALSLGLPRAEAIRMVTEDSVAEAVIPSVDSTRTVGLVTLPGAFIGVLLGGGSAVQAAAAQLLVLVGILAGQAATVVVAHRLICAGLLLPPDLRRALHQ